MSSDSAASVGVPRTDRRTATCQIPQQLLRCPECVLPHNGTSQVKHLKLVLLRNDVAVLPHKQQYLTTPRSGVAGGA